MPTDRALEERGNGYLTERAISEQLRNLRGALHVAPQRLYVVGLALDICTGILAAPRDHRRYLLTSFLGWCEWKTHIYGHGSFRPEYRFLADLARFVRWLDGGGYLPDLKHRQWTTLLDTLAALRTPPAASVEADATTTPTP